MKRRLTIYITKEGEPRRKGMIRFFKIQGFDINGEATLTIDDASGEYEVLKQAAARGLIQIRNKP